MENGNGERERVDVVQELSRYIVDTSLLILACQVSLCAKRTVPVIGVWRSWLVAQGGSAAINLCLLRKMPQSTCGYLIHPKNYLPT